MVLILERWKLVVTNTVMKIISDQRLAKPATENLKKMSIIQKMKGTQ